MYVVAIGKVHEINQASLHVAIGLIIFAPQLKIIKS
jgi:hypothetical protein